MGYLQIAILSLTFLLGAGTGYFFEHTQVLILESKINTQKIEAAAILAKEVERISISEKIQRDLNTQLDNSREALITTSNSYSIKQSALIDSLRFTKSGKGCNNPSNGSANTLINPKNAEEFTWVSKKLLNYLAGESKRAEQDGIDKNTLMTFVLDQNCGITKANK